MRFINRDVKIRDRVLQRQKNWWQEKVEPNVGGQMAVKPECRFAVRGDDSTIVFVQSDCGQCFIAAECDSPLEAQILCEALNYLLRLQKTETTVTTQAERVDEI